MEVRAFVNVHHDQKRASFFGDNASRTEHGGQGALGAAYLNHFRNCKLST
jgi:hypothetical protein